jgi:predicted nucleotidyltransferase
MNYKFWNNWKRKTQQEKRYIKSLEKALNWLKNQSFAKDIIAVYVKGSFVDRELMKKSDIDIVPVMKDKKSSELVRKLRNPKKLMLAPAEILPIAIQELKMNKRYKKPALNKPQGKPDQFTILLPYYKLVYGKHLDTKGWKRRADAKIYSDLNKAIKGIFIPLYEKEELGFNQVIKQVKNLVWWEERLKGRRISLGWKAIKKACPNNKLLQKAVYWRFHPAKNEKTKEKYLKEIFEYLKP